MVLHFRLRYCVARSDRAQESEVSIDYSSQHLHVTLSADGSLLRGLTLNVVAKQTANAHSTRSRLAQSTERSVFVGFVCRDRSVVDLQLKKENVGKMREMGQHGVSCD